MTSRNGKARAPAPYLHRLTIDHSGRWSAISAEEAEDRMALGAQDRGSRSSPGWETR